MPSEPLKDEWRKGKYCCARCGSLLFRSDDKFESCTFWPSFRKEAGGAVEFREDLSHGMRRVEIICKKCGLHLGHVFDDGLQTGDEHPDAGRRFCVLSSSLSFRAKR
ncbi:MAG: peptide-methionine (R)-S-oxide reductase [Candidatus Marsarchaeota archaeon]|nr:peptide-methionine (R)-S-oxide reductase [Candidatus Marsarchaeota archaeon]